MDLEGGIEHATVVLVVQLPLFFDPGNGLDTCVMIQTGLGVGLPQSGHGVRLLPPGCFLKVAWYS